MSENGLKTKRVSRILFATIIVFWTVFLGVVGFSVAEKRLYPLEYKEEILQVADNYVLERELLFAFVRTESGFDANATSIKGAVGLMQILPSTAEFIAKNRGIVEYNLYDIKTNLDFGGYYIRYLMERFNGLTEVAAAYNAGEGNVRSWLKNADYSSDGITLYKIPYSETERYVQKIYKSLESYRKLYGKLLDK